MIAKLRSLLASKPVGLKEYRNTSASPYCSPALGGSADDSLTFTFILDRSWSQLYEREKRETHKISGVTDLLGRNSVRLGVRRAPYYSDKQNGLVAVFYLHQNGDTTYYAIKDLHGKPLFLKYDTQYTCEAYKTGYRWNINIKLDGKLIASETTKLSISSFGRRISSIYIEPPLYNITTFLQVL